MHIRRARSVHFLALVVFAVCAAGCVLDSSPRLERSEPSGQDSSDVSKARIGVDLVVDELYDVIEVGVEGGFSLSHESEALDLDYEVGPLFRLRHEERAVNFPGIDDRLSTLMLGAQSRLYLGGANLVQPWLGLAGGVYATYLDGLYGGGDDLYAGVFARLAAGVSVDLDAGMCLEAYVSETEFLGSGDDFDPDGALHLGLSHRF